MRRIFVAILTFYQKYISPQFPRCCRFYPTCSSYAKQAFERYGVFKGFWLSAWRLLRCNPFNPGGYDPVP